MTRPSSTVRELCDTLDAIAPLTLAEPWDNVGLLLGSFDAPVQTIMTCLTLTETVADEAVNRHAQLIVTHHPILFRGVKRLTSETSEGRTLLKLMSGGIAVYSAHTAFDSAAMGINQSLAESLGLSDIQPLRPATSDPRVGGARFGRLPTPLDREQLLSQLSRIVNAQSFEVAWNGSQPSSVVAVACGSAAEYLADAARFGCDTFITGEARFHAAMEAQSLKINLVLTGHFSSERPAITALAIRLQSLCPALEVFASEQERNPLEWYRA